MKNELNIRKCEKCGAMIRVVIPCTCDNCGINCCGQEMETLVPNSVNAAVEKHMPVIERTEDEIFVKVNHVMEKEHYIEFITLVAQNKEYTVNMYPEQNAECRFPYIPKSTVYAYCNKHGLWKIDVK